MYKKILSGYVNDSKKGDGKYLSITNNSDEDVIIEVGKSIHQKRYEKKTRKYLCLASQLRLMKSQQKKVIINK